jgi:hypothetical protein
MSVMDELIPRSILETEARRDMRPLGSVRKLAIGGGGDGGDEGDKDEEVGFTVSGSKEGR